MYRLISIAALSLGLAVPTFAQEADTEPATDSAGLEPLIRIDPGYPRDAQLQGIEGSVTVELTVNPFGLVESAEVVESTPPGIFDGPTLAAVMRWRYLADPEREPVTLTEQVDFTVSDVVWRLSSTAALPANPAPRNDCVRENVTYDFGEMVEVGLINTCADPLLVFGCAQGTGQHTGMWVCIDSERLETVLLRPGDGRVGSVTINDPTFSYGDNIFVARAPNTQYWWIACQESDASCRDVARQWVRAVDRQVARLNPQDRASVNVARSR